MHVDAGELNKRIEIVRLDRTKTPNGYDEITETVVHRCWAKFTQTTATVTSTSSSGASG